MKSIAAFALVFVALTAVNAQIGGWKTVPTTGLTSNAQFMKIVNFGLQQSQVEGTLGEGTWSVESIDQVSTQVVAGMNYKIVCTVQGPNGGSENMVMVVYDQPWTGTMKLISSQILLTAMEDFAVVGGYSPMSNDELSMTSNAQLAGYVEYALGALNAEDPEFAAQGWSVSKIVSGSTQVVAGMNYELDVELTNAAGQSEEMEWVIFVQPWTNTIKLTSSQVIS